MSDRDNWEKRLSDNSLTILVAILLIAVIATALVSGFYLAYFRNIPIEANPAPWGQFGDFFGGTLNPIFGFLSVMALLAALVIQGRELKVSSEELKNSARALDAQNKTIIHQSFEQTFFSWLENYRDMVKSIEYVAPQSMGGREFHGKRALRRWWEESLDKRSLASRILQLDNKVNNDISNLAGEQMFNAVVNEQPELVTDVAIEYWELLYRSNEYHLDSLFRNLYKLISWIDSQDELRMNWAQKWFYVSIVRAQLSWMEMVYLFYNGYTDRGMKFRRLIDKYALFDNLNFDSDQVIACVKKFPPSGRSYAETAYDSCLARRKLGLPESTEDTLAAAVVLTDPS